MKTYLEPEEIVAMENSTSNLRDRLLVRVLFHLGCRISESLGITLSDIDFSRGTVTILHLKSRISLTCPVCKVRLGRRHRFCPECGGGVSQAIMRQQEHRRMRTLPIDSDTLSILADFIRSHNVSSSIFGINRHRAWHIVKECGKRANITDLVNPETGKLRGISPHRLRDAFAVHAVKLNDSGDGLRLLQEHLGHTSFNTTAKYRKVGGAEHRQWYDELWRKRSF